MSNFSAGVWVANSIMANASRSNDRRRGGINFSIITMLCSVRSQRRATTLHSDLLQDCPGRAGEGKARLVDLGNGMLLETGAYAVIDCRRWLNLPLRM